MLQVKFPIELSGNSAEARSSFSSESKQPFQFLLSSTRAGGIPVRKHLNQKKILEIVEADVPAPSVVVAKIFGRQAVVCEHHFGLLAAREKFHDDEGLVGGHVLGDGTRRQRLRTS